MRSENMLLLALVLDLLVPCSTQTTNTEARCGSDVSLPCNADFNKNYFSVTWYKNNKEGIIRKKLGTNETQLYIFPRNVSLSEQNGLLIRKVTPDDSGTYECRVGANVGGQNLYLFVTLKVPECEPETTNSLTTSITTSLQTESTFAHEPHQASAHSLPLVWSLGGYFVVVLTKIILSLMIIWIFHICSRCKRR